MKGVFWETYIIMSTDLYRRCTKCGITPYQDELLTFHRFPKPGKLNILRAKAWAMYCWPEREPWSMESLNKLFSSNKVLCKRHFQDSCFTNSTKTRLSKYSVPGEKQYAIQLMDSLRSEMKDDSEETERGGNVTPTNSNTDMLTSLNVRKMNKLNKRQQSRRRKLRRKNILKNLHENESLAKLLDLNMSSSFALLLRSQMITSLKKAKARRHNLDMKIKALNKCIQKITTTLLPSEALVA